MTTETAWAGSGPYDAAAAAAAGMGNWGGMGEGNWSGKGTGKTDASAGNVGWSGGTTDWACGAGGKGDWAKGAWDAGCGGKGDWTSGKGGGAGKGSGGQGGYWERFCEVARMGSGDPAALQSAFTGFIEAISRGEDPKTAVQPVGRTRFLRLRGVPFQAEPIDVANFLAYYGVDQFHVAIGRRDDGKPTGEAFAAFGSIEIAERALAEMQRQEIHGRYIELYPASEAEFTHMASLSPLGVSTSGDPEKDDLISKVKHVQRMGQMQKEVWYTYCEKLGSGNRDPSRHTKESLRHFLESFQRGEIPEPLPSQLPGGSSVLRLRGVPFQSEVNDVVAFLQEYFVDPQNVTLGVCSDGRKTGEAFVQFASPELAERAFNEKQKQEIQGRYIELFRSSIEERDQMAFPQAIPGVTPAIEKGGGKGWVSTGDPEKDKLVVKVKQIQKSGPDGRLDWEQYCELIRTGNRDPRLHTTESLAHFIEAIQNGEGPVGAARRADTKSTVVRLRGVPFQSDVNDILEFLSGYEVDASQVSFGRVSDGRPTGEAFVVFPSVEHANAALEERQKKEIRGRYIELFRSSLEEKAQNADQVVVIGSGDPVKDELVIKVKTLQRSSPAAREMWDDYCLQALTGNKDPARHTAESMRNFLEAYERGEKPMPQPGAGGPVLRLRGVPFQCDVEDVVEFLKEYGVDWTQVTLGVDATGRMAGEAYVVFPSTQLADRAMIEKQRMEIHGRYIELFRSSFEEKREALELVQKTAEQAPLTGDVMKDQLVQKVKAVQRSGASGKNQWERFCDAMRTGNRDPVRHSSESLRNFLQAYKTGEAPEDLAMRLGRSKVLRLRGVPFQAETSDIVNFLAEYFVDPNQVSFLRNADGRPTGEAFVMFHTEEFAERALNEKQQHLIHGRYIELFRSSEDEMLESLSTVATGGSAVSSGSRTKGAGKGKAKGDGKGGAEAWGSKGGGGKADSWPGPDKEKLFEAMMNMMSTLTSQWGSGDSGSWKGSGGSKGAWNDWSGCGDAGTWDAGKGWDASMMGGKAGSFNAKGCGKKGSERFAPYGGGKDGGWC